MDPVNPIERALMRLFRPGRVSSVDAAKHTAQVEFTEGDGVVSYDLPMLVTRAGDYGLPEAGAAVLCVMLPGTSGQGFVLGSFYNDEDAPPLSDAGQRSIASDDLRLGDPTATDKVALAPATKGELDKIKAELDSIQLGLSTHTHPYVDTPIGAAVTSPPAVPPYTNGYTATSPAAEKVKAK